MSEENVAMFGSGYAAVNCGDIDGLLVAVHPDVEFTSLIAEAEGETFRGHDGVRRWWKGVVLPLGGLHGEPEEVRDLGDTVVVRVLGTYRPRGVEVRQTGEKQRFAWGPKWIPALEEKRLFLVPGFPEHPHQ